MSAIPLRRGNFSRPSIIAHDNISRGRSPIISRIPLFTQSGRSQDLFPERVHCDLSSRDRNHVSTYPWLLGKTLNFLRSGFQARTLHPAIPAQPRFLLSCLNGEFRDIETIVVLNHRSRSIKARWRFWGCGKSQIPRLMKWKIRFPCFHNQHHVYAGLNGSLVIKLLNSGLSGLSAIVAPGYADWTVWTSYQSYVRPHTGYASRHIT